MKRSLVSIVCVSVAVLVGGCGTTSANGSSTNASSSTQASSTPSASKADSTFESGVLTTPDLKIEITDHKVIQVGEKGNEYGKKPVIAFWYKVTNNGDKEVSPMNFIFSITAYQDNNPNAENKLDVGSLPDDRFLSSQTEKVKKGGTVENAIAYELDDLTTDVDLVATKGLGSGEIGKVTYKLQ